MSIVLSTASGGVGCDTTSNGTPAGPVRYHGSHSCTTDADCPQYYSMCLPYEGACQGGPKDQVVGNCGCDESWLVDEPCGCAPCDGKDDEYIEVGTSLCARFDLGCDRDSDCPGEGMHCWDLTGMCSPNPEGHLSCSSDADCLFGWECIDNPEEARMTGCDSPKYETELCCAERVCAPRGWNGPLIGCT
ncbi:MAG: hypothetical protein ABIK09_19885 [Pseudomonadota bacterium]